MFCDTFREWCEAKGTAPDLALQELGLSASALHSWKTHIPSRAALPKMAEYFGLDMQTVCDGVKDHLRQRPGYAPKICTGEAVSHDNVVMTRITMEYFPELPVPWAFRVISKERLVSEEEIAAHKAKTIALAAPVAVPILRHLYGDEP